MSLLGAVSPLTQVAMSYPNLTLLENEVYRSRQAVDAAMSRHVAATKALADAKATIARREARSEDEPDTDDEEDEEDDEDDTASVESVPHITLPWSEYMSKKDNESITKIYSNPKKVMKAWKRVLENGIHDNITGILNECRENFAEEGNIEGMSSEQINAVIKDWSGFTKEVYASLKKNGSFITGDKYIFNDFEDTAGGCDEIVWDAACELIEEKGETM